MELASCHPPGTENLEVAPRFLYNSYNPEVSTLKLHWNTGPQHIMKVQLWHPL